MGEKQIHKTTTDAAAVADGGQPQKKIDPAQAARRRRNDIVARRNQPLRRVGRFIRRFWFIMLIVVLWLYARSSPFAFNAVLSLLQIILQLAFAIVFMILLPRPQTQLQWPPHKRQSEQRPFVAAR